MYQFYNLSNMTKSPKSQSSQSDKNRVIVLRDKLQGKTAPNPFTIEPMKTIDQSMQQQHRWETKCCTHKCRRMGSLHCRRLC